MKKEIHYEQVTLDRVFDVQWLRPCKSTPKRVQFSFEYRGRPRYALQISGWPSLRQGDTLILAMREKGNTQTLICWKNATTGELAYHRDDDMGPVVLSLILSSMILVASSMELFLSEWVVSRDFLWWCIGGSLVLFLVSLSKLKTVKKSEERAKSIISKLDELAREANHANSQHQKVFNFEAYRCDGLFSEIDQTQM